MLDDDLATALDPVRLFRTAVGGPDPWQEQLLRGRYPRALLLCCRQAGKSTVAAVEAVHEAMYRSGSLTLVLSPSLRQSGELFKKVMTVYKASGRPVDVARETQLTLELANGSRIVSLPESESTIRGYSAVDLLVIDEAARVEDPVYAAVRPMLAVSGGRLLALTTPFGTRGWLWAAWYSAEPWHRVLVPATACPRIPADFLDEERQALGEWAFTQEYMVRFAEGVGSVFSEDWINSAFGKVKPLFPPQHTFEGSTR